MTLRRFLLPPAGWLLVPALCLGQSLSFEEYEPKSTLVVPQNPRPRAKFPIIDVHSHHSSLMSRERLLQVVADMDRLNLAVLVNLSGGSGRSLKEGVANLQQHAPGRWIVFANVDFSGLDDPQWGRRAAAQLEEDYRNGARGLKIFKNLGLTVTDSKGRVPTDDPRLDPLWAKAGELGIPVLIHTGEPKPFFDPVDKYNERWLELKLHPSRARPADRYPPWETVMAEQHRLFARHPKTTFINAHLGWLGGNLAELGRLLDRLPNVYTEMGAVIAELGRQPRNARQWLIKYQDRVLFGKDSWVPSEYPTYFRVLETADEYFDYHKKYHAFWKMYGVDLPDEVLKKLYYKNALKVIPGIDPARFPQ